MVEKESIDIPKISVIVPVYKAEAYLHRCVDSILAQTFKDWELLLIDDGSPDKSGEICDEYAQKDSRVRVIHKENGGVSSARQRGLDESIGEYTIHADPDDWVEPDMLEELYRKAKEEDADMVICDFINEYEGGKQRYMKQQPESLESRAVLRQLLFQQLHGSCWNKLVRRACYIKWGIRFPNNLNYCEDVIVLVQLLQHDIKIFYIMKAFYHYDQQVNLHSITRKYTTDTFRMRMYYLDCLKERLEKRILEDVFNTQYTSVVFEAFSYDLFSDKQFANLFRKNAFCFLNNNNLGVIYRIFLFIGAIGIKTLSLRTMKGLIFIKSGIVSTKRKFFR